MGPAATLQTPASIVYREEAEEEGPIRHGKLPSLPVWAPPRSRQQDGLKCKECSPVHKQYLSLTISFFSVLVEGGPGLSFSFSEVGAAIASNRLERGPRYSTASV